MKQLNGIIRYTLTILLIGFSVTILHARQTKWPQSLQDSLLSITAKPMSVAQVKDLMYLCERQMIDFPKEVSTVLSSIINNQKLKKPELIIAIYQIAGQSSYFASDYNNAGIYFSKAGQLAKNSADKSLLYQSIYWEAKVFRSQNLHAEALSNLHRIIRDSVNVVDTSLLVRTMLDAGEVYYQMASYHSALKYLHLANYKLKGLSDKLLVGEFLNRVGSVYFVIGRYDLALENFLKALPVLSEVKQYKTLASVQNNIGLVYKTLGSYDLAKSYLEKSMVYEEEVANINGLTSSFINVGSLYLLQNQPELAYKYLARAADQALSINDSVLIAAVFVSLSDYYIYKSDFGRAKQNAMQALAISSRIVDKRGMVEAMLCLGIVAKEQKAYADAQQWYDKSLTLASGLDLMEPLSRIYQHRARLFEIQGQSLQAFISLEMHVKYKDSVSGPGIWRKIADLQALQKLAEKSHELEFLNNSFENQEQQIADLNSRVAISNYFRIGFLLVCVILATVFILMYYLDKKSGNYKNEIEELRHKLIENRKLLKNSIEKAEEADKIKDNFLQTMTHELRTPLNGIIGFSEILYEELNSPEKQEIAKTIMHSGIRLMSTLNSILDLSDIEARRIELSYTDISLSKLIESCIARYNYAARQRNLDLSPLLKVPDCYIRSDVDIVTKILSNLIDNAIKYTKQGSITVELDLQHQGEEVNAVLRVRDTGMGIPEDRLELVFSRFRQASEGNTRSHEGTGIGLSLTRNLVNLLGGSIGVSSKQNQGSVFTVILPALNQTKDITGGLPSVSSFFLKESTDQSKLPLLLVEDEETNREFAIYALHNHFNIDLALDGKSALKMANDKQYEIILLDVNLGKEMNGIEVVKQLRSMPKYEKVPIAAVTANALKAQRDAFLKSGFSHYLAKPYTRRELQALVRNMLSGGSFDTNV